MGHAIFVDGQYPAVMREKIDAKSEAQGFEESRLPTFSEEDSAMILGSSDFLGMNFYTAQIVYPEASGPELVDFYADPDVGSYQDETWYGSVLLAEGVSMGHPSGD